MTQRWIMGVLTVLLLGLFLLSPWPLLAAERPKAAPKGAPEEPSIFAPAAPPETPRRPADPSPEICAKVREARMKTTYECLSCGWAGSAPALADEAGVLGDLLWPVRCCPQCGEEVRIKDVSLDEL